MNDATTILPNHTGARLLSVTWQSGRAREITSPILGWEIAPGRDPRPVTLLGNLDRLAWAVLADGGVSFIPGQAVYLNRDDAVRELTARARELVEVAQRTRQIAARNTLDGPISAPPSLAPTQGSPAP